MSATILIVEDSPTQAEALSFLLEQNGYDPTVATTGERALALVERQPFDLVLSDINMPGIDGFELCRRLKATLRKAKVPVVLISSMSDPMDILQGLAAGADNYLSKPYQPEQLLARIHSVLQNAALRRGTKAHLGVTVNFLGSTFTITSEREQILDLLFSTFEDAVVQNRRLREQEEELRRAKAELARYAGTLEERLKQVLDSVPDVLFSLDSASGRFHYLSPACRRVLAIDPEQLQSDLRPWWAALDPADRAKLRSSYRSAILSGQPCPIGFQIRHPGGTVRDIEGNIIPVIGPDGRPSRIDGIVRDITERKRGEEQLRQSEERFRLLVEGVKDYALLTLDPVGLVTSWNVGAERLMGYRADEILEQHFSRFSTEEDREHGKPKHQLEVAASDGQIRTAGWQVRKDGSQFLASILITALRDGPGTLRGFVKLTQDITELRRAEEAQRARELAEAANRAKSQFLANMSHELRTPLNAIIGFSELLEDQAVGALNDKQKKYATNIQTSGRHLLHLINDILDLAKVETGRLTLELSTFALAAALGEVQRTVESLALAKRLTMDFDVPADLPEVTADRAKFKQIIYNLVSNAIKFTPEGGRIRLTARILPGAEGAPGTLQVSVADTGIGIRLEDQDRIFLEFEQVVGSAESHGQRGTGLGLALTRRLVELHGGRIWVESELSQGSTFTFSLPLMPPSPVEEALVAAAPLVSDPTDPRPLVLVVEDNREASELLTHYLRDNGYAVAHARNGAEALEAAQRLKPLAITLDILLPDQDGLDVLVKLRALAETEQIPVVVVSITTDRTLGLRLGAAEWLVKPVSRDAFLQTIRQVVSPRLPARPTVVLLVDDHRETVDLLADALEQRGFRAFRGYSGEEGLRIAVEELPDAIVLDLVMPGLTGLQVLEQLREQPATHDIPVLIFTSKEMTEKERSKLRGRVHAIVSKSEAGDLLQLLQRLPARRRSGESG